MITANTTIYKDDFNENDVEAKNYLRMLFRGGRAVQVREMNQLQSMLQSQIDKFGQSIWKNGSAVIGGNCTFDSNIRTLSFSKDDLFTLDGGGAPDPDSLIFNLDRARFMNQGSIDAEIIDYDSDIDFGIDPTDPSNGSYVTFYIRYSSGDAGVSDGTFDIASVVAIASDDDIEYEEGWVSGSYQPSGKNKVRGAFLQDGVFFTQGSFVIAPKQNFFFPKVSGSGATAPWTGKIILRVEENFVDSTQDPTLNDNSNGLPNYMAPGADRYQVVLTLDAIPADGEMPENAILLHTIESDQVIIHSKERYSDLDRQFAQRTWEESGSYTINPFRIELSEMAPRTPPGKPVAVNNVYVGLDPSIAYVEGYRVELPRRLDMAIPKARTTSGFVDTSISLQVGNYIDVTPKNPTKIPKNDGIIYSLLKGPDPVNDKIGETRIRTTEAVGGNFRLYLYDIRLNSGQSVGDIVNIYSSSGYNFAAVGLLSGAAQDTAIFQVAYDNVNDLTNTYRVIRDVQTGSGSATASFTVSSSFGNVTDYSPNNIIVEVNGNILATGSYTITPAGTNGLTIGLSSATATSWAVTFPVRNTTGLTSVGTKTLTNGTDTGLNPSGRIYTLTKSHLLNVTSIKIGGSGPDIKDQFEIVSDGQRSSFYTNATIKYVGGGTPPSNLTVAFRYFADNGVRPFTVKSYNIQFNPNSIPGASQIFYREVPEWNGRKVTDYVDYRPLILNNAATSGFANSEFDPGSSSEFQASQYLGRTDKVVVSSAGEFSIVPGVPSTNPIAPPTPPSSMVLYELDVPPYTFEVKDIGIRPVENRRYTMRDIGKLEKRIENLEYYTSLSLLEKSVEGRSIFDDVQGARFKNGMLVDAFSGHGIGDVFNPAYRCSIDGSTGELRPFFDTVAVDMKIESTSGISINENTVTRAFAQVPLIEQLKASETESVNPYDIAVFAGEIDLYPSVDQWMETNRRPNIIVNDDNNYDALQYVLEEQGILGYEWNSWETNWTGSTLKVQNGREVGISKKYTVYTTTTTSEQSRSGTLTSLSSTQTETNMGDRVVDVSFIPFIRSRRVYFIARGLKPNVRVYPFFDGVRIDDYTQQVATSGDIVKPQDLEEVVEYFGMEPNQGGIISTSPFVSTSDGELFGSFVIPNNNLLKFATGQRMFRLSDSPTGNLNEETTNAEGQYSATGQTQTVEATILSTKTPVISTERVSESRVVEDVTVRYKEPLAQTFLVDTIKEGVFITSIDLFFSQSSKIGLPVNVYVVTADNGYPSQKILPYSSVLVNASTVDADIAAERETRFSFSDPVYLKSGVEYAFVIMSNDPEYRVEVARLGGKDFTTQETIQANPYAGVMFTSQNASTWSADQSRDIKFRINRAQFTSGGGDSLVTFGSIIRRGVQSVVVTNQGSGYTSAPTVSFSAAPTGGRTAQGIVEVDYITGVRSVRVTDPGFGYTSAPTVSFSGGGGSGMAATATLFSHPVSAVSLLQSAVSPEKTTLRTSIRDNASVFFSQNAQVGETYEYPSIVSEYTVDKDNRIFIESRLNNSSEYVSPIISFEGLSLLLIHNKVNADLTGEDLDFGGNSLSRYFTREAELNDPADQLNIYLDVNRPIDGANITVYGRLKYDSNTWSNWLEISPTQRAKVSTNRDTFGETQYVLESSQDFTAFRIKIVPTSSTSTRVPRARNLRVIATS